jgi:hypothetical protein
MSLFLSAACRAAALHYCANEGDLNPGRNLNRSPKEAHGRPSLAPIRVSSGLRELHVHKIFDGMSDVCVVRHSPSDCSHNLA